MAWENFGAKIQCSAKSFTFQTNSGTSMFRRIGSIGGFKESRRLSLNPKHKAQSTKHKAQRAKFKEQSKKHKVCIRCANDFMKCFFHPSEIIKNER